MNIFFPQPNPVVDLYRQLDYRSSGVWVIWIIGSGVVDFFLKNGEGVDVFSSQVKSNTEFIHCHLKAIVVFSVPIQNLQLPH